jgi:hypothetical protein
MLSKKLKTPTIPACPMKSSGKVNHKELLTIPNQVGIPPKIAMKIVAKIGVRNSR